MSTILLVDDEQDLLELFGEVLEQMNHRVVMARDGREALQVAQQAVPDLVVTDWMMPRMDGLELCHRFHADARLHHVPIILHSSAGDPHAPGAQFVPKSASLEDFERLVDRVLASTHARRSMASPSHDGARAPPTEVLRSTSSFRTTLLFGLGELACSTAH